jgi:hypothetical protein
MNETAPAWFDGQVGDLVCNEHDDNGTVLRVTPSWVLVDDGSPDGRWVHRDRFEDGTWWTA